MAFTVSSYNLNNRFHVSSPFHICVELCEKALFSLLRQVLLLIPAYETPETGQTLAVKHPSSCECIDVRQVMDSCRTEEKNSILVPVPCRPAKILSVTITDVNIINKKCIPLPNRKTLAIVYYSYSVTVNYIDIYKRHGTISRASCTRCQKAYLKSSAGYLDILLNIKATGTDIKQKSAPDHPGRNIAARPARLWSRPVMHNR